MLVSKLRAKLQKDKNFKEEEHPRAGTGKHAGEFVKKGMNTSTSKKNKAKQAKFFKKGEIFYSKNFSNQDFSNKNFKENYFNHVSFKGALFNKSTIRNSDLSRTSIQGASFKNVKISYSAFPADLSNVDFTGANINYMDCFNDIEHMKLNGTKFHNLKLDNIGFFEDVDDILVAVKKGASFKNATFMGQRIDNVVKYGKDFESLKEKYHKTMKGKIFFEKGNSKLIPIKSLEKIIGILQADKINIELEENSNNKTFSANIEWKTKDSNRDRGEMMFTISPNNKELHLDLMFLSGKLQSKGLGLNIIRNFEKQASKLGVDKISLLANISIGTYAWPRLGFDFKDASTLNKTKRKITDFCKEMNIPLDDSLKKKINSLKTAYDIATFDIGKKFSYSDGLPRFCIKNRDVNPNLKMHLGKIILLYVVDSFNAIKRV